MAERSKHNIRAISCRKWVGTILLVVGLSSLLGGFTLGCGSGGTSTTIRTDPLTIKEMQTELDKLPRPLDEVLRSLSSKQDYFENYLMQPRDPDVDEDIARRTLEHDIKSTEHPVVWAEGYSKEDVVAFIALMTWDSWTGGQRSVNVTADWRVYLDKEQNIVAYSRTLYQQ